jgi:hypothetical protein
MTEKYTVLFLLTAIYIITFSSCERRPLDIDELPPVALIPVKIDWSRSGINFETGSGVHRVSLRFYPKDSRQDVFDCYLEGNVTEGKIQIPVGKYSVIVFNESVQDVYWDGRIKFTDINSYSNFAANAVPYGDADRRQQFPFYSPQAGEKFIAEPLHLASWSIDNFEVTENMMVVAQGQKPFSYLSTVENDMFYALTKIVMRALTRPVIVTARIENLISSQTNYLAMQGFTTRVNMATGLPVSAPATFLFTLNGRKYDPDKLSGTSTATFLSFGRTAAPESYKIAMDILFVTGELYKPAQPLLFDVTDQVLSSYNTDINIYLNISLALPYVEGGIAVDDWEDNYYTLE